jgi:hypothetical protein
MDVPLKKSRAPISEMNAPLSETHEGMTQYRLGDDVDGAAMARDRCSPQREPFQALPRWVRPSARIVQGWRVMACRLNVTGVRMTRKADIAQRDACILVG